MRDTSTERFWNGSQWTNSTRPAGAVAGAPGQPTIGSSSPSLPELASPSTSAPAFCSNCGSPLGDQQPRFCGHCGNPIAQNPSLPLAAARLQVQADGPTDGRVIPPGESSTGSDQPDWARVAILTFIGALVLVIGALIAGNSGTSGRAGTGEEQSSVGEGSDYASLIDVEVESCVTYLSAPAPTLLVTNNSDQKLFVGGTVEYVHAGGGASETSGFNVIAYPGKTVRVKGVAVSGDYAYAQCSVIDVTAVT